MKIFPAAIALFGAMPLLAQSELKVGAAEVIITPPVGTGMAGYYHYRGSDGVLDDIRAKAIVLDDGTMRVALITLDLIAAPRGLVEAVRVDLDKSGIIKGAQVMISATHAHTGPNLESSEKVPDKSAGSNPDAEAAHAHYLAALPILIADSVRKAAAKLAPTMVTVVSGHCDDVAFCRRFYMKDGIVSWNPGKMNPDVMLATGPTDPEVQAVFFTSPHELSKHVPAMAVYANFSMHPDTVGGVKFSADYPGALARTMAGYHGSHCITLYGNGASGNLNHFDTSWSRQQGGILEANRIGTLLAASIFRAEKSELVTGGAVHCKSVTVPLAVPSVTPEQVERARETIKLNNDGDRRSFMELVHAWRVLDLKKMNGQPIPAEVQVITLGNDVAWIGLPGEVFVELGLALKKRSPFSRTIITTLANGSWGYLPDRRSYAEANYEPESARVVPGSGEQLVDAAVLLLNELHAR